MRTKSGLPKRKPLRRMPIFEYGFRDNPRVVKERSKDRRSSDPRPITAVSFFSGCGGLDLGISGGFSFLGNYYEKHNVNIVAAYDNDARAVDAYKLNISDHAHVLDLSACDMEKMPKADVLLGGFPCQDFSSCGYKRGFSGERGQLYLAMVEYMRRHRPKIVVGENVPLLKGLKEGAYLEKIINDIEAVGYNVKTWFINCPDYGLPASRRRIFIICVREDIAGFPTMPEPSHVMAQVSIDDAIHDLIDITDESVPNQSQYFVATKATAGAGQGDQKSKAGELGYAVRANAKARVHFHYELDRRLTVRELARLQSFPDEFVFPYAAGPNVILIGNAVPPIVGHAVGRSVLTFIQSRILAASRNLMAVDV